MPTRQREDDFVNQIQIVLPGATIHQQQSDSSQTSFTGTITSTILGYLARGEKDTTKVHPINSLISSSVSTSKADETTNEDDDAAATAGNNTSSIFIQSTNTSNQFLTPTKDADVLFRVTKVQANAASGPIVAINNQWCSANFRGLVRLEDIRNATARDIAAGLVPTHAADSYRLGDLVAAKVLSLTDARQFQLTTAPAHCGVVKCFSERKFDGAYRHADPKRRDVIIVADEAAGAGVEKLVSRWVPDVRTLTVQ